MSSYIRHIGSILALSLGWVTAASAVTVVIDYDGAPSASKKDFVTTPYYENGVTTTVDTGHYDFYADSTGDDGDLAFNIDDQHNGLTRVTITAQGLLFDVLSLDVINPADAATGETYTITAIGGGGGSIPAPATTGPLNFGPQFEGVTALVITQTSAGTESSAAFAFDDLTIRSLPEPSMIGSLCAAGLALFALSRRRTR